MITQKDVHISQPYSLNYLKDMKALLATWISVPLPQQAQRSCSDYLQPTHSRHHLIPTIIISDDYLTNSYTQCCIVSLTILLASHLTWVTLKQCRKSSNIHLLLISQIWPQNITNPQSFMWREWCASTALRL